LKIPQPTLSRYLRVLEEHCDTALLRRDTHRMNLTQTGQPLLEDARSMLAHAEAADQRLREDQITAPALEAVQGFNPGPSRVNFSNTLLNPSRYKPAASPACVPELPIWNDDAAKIDLHLTELLDDLAGPDRMAKTTDRRRAAGNRRVEGGCA
jgi:Bacterial regulatory helix-turn-helix protein, lysR family